MRTIKIEKEATKAEVYVVVDTNEKMLEVKEILSSSNQRYLGCISGSGTANILVYDKQYDAWYKLLHAEDRQCEITVPQLAELLGVEYPLRKRVEEKKLPTLEELIEEARSKIEVKLGNYPCWVDEERTVSKYCIDENRIQAYTEKEAIAQYVKEKVLEML